MLEFLALLVIILATWLPRGLALDAFVTPDERLWLNRSANYYYALTQGDFASTNQAPHPGVTTMWAGTAGFLARFRGYRASGLGLASGGEFHNYLKYEANIPALDLLRAGRIFMVLGNTLALVIGYLYARKLLGLLPALIGFLLIAFDPFHLALTRLLHLDGLLSSLYLLSLLAFIYFLQRRRALDLVVSSVAAGLCWLTKSPGFFLGLVVGLLTLIELWRSYSIDKDHTIWKRIWRYVWPVLTWVVIGALVFVIFWPAMWVDPVQSLTSLFGAVQTAAEQGHYTGTFFYGNVSQKMGLASAYFYPVTFLWRTTPVVILGLLLAIWGFITKRKPFDQSSARFTVMGLALSAVLFTLGMSLGEKKKGRYLLPIYAPLDLIAGMGWVCLAYWIKERKISVLSKYSFVVVLVPVLAIQVFLSVRTFPYYYSYFNPIMGGSQKAPEVLQIGWGEGLDQAAQYLNQKPGAKNMNVLSWYASGSFSYFFVGQTLSLGADPEFNEGEMRKLRKSDYVVVYINQRQRNRPEELLDYLSELEPEKTIWINDIEYVRIYKMR